MIPVSCHVYLSQRTPGVESGCIPYIHRKPPEVSYVPTVGRRVSVCPLAFYLDDHAELRALAGVSVGSNVVLHAVRKLTCVCGRPESRKRRYGSREEEAS